MVELYLFLKLQIVIDGQEKSLSKAEIDLKTNSI